jgi:(2Fe-2S) ferredoxin
MADGVRLVVCVNQRLGPGQKSCAGSGSRNLLKTLRDKLAARQLDYPVVEQVCLGRCLEGPAMRIAPGGSFFTAVSEPDLDRIIDQLDAFEPNC